MKKKAATKTGKPSQSAQPKQPAPKKQSSEPVELARPRQSWLRSLFRLLTVGFTFTFVTTICAGVGATIALVVPLGFLPGVSDDSAVPIQDLLSLQRGISRPINLLVMGIDRNLEAEPGTSEIFQGRSDTMLLVRLNPETKRVSILTIPRDTRVLIPEYGYTKINAANFEGGPKLAMKVVSTTLNDVPIDRYVRISTGAFREFVDVVGGLELFVPTRMKYEDKTQGLFIDLEPGLQTLNGEQAEGFMRYRKDLGDIGRGQRQQVLIRALQKQLATPATLTRLPQLLEVMKKHLDTDLSVGEMLALGQFSLQLEREQLHMVMLPGRFSGAKEYEQSFWIMKHGAVDDLMAAYFEVKPPKQKRPARALVKERPIADRISISVQNASGDPEGGVRMIEYLRSQGFNRVYQGATWPQILPNTQVIPQWGDIKAAEYVTPLLANSELSVNSTGDLGKDITVRVGKSWLNTQQATSPDGSAGSTIFWDQK